MTFSTEKDLHGIGFLGDSEGGMKGTGGSRGKGRERKVVIFLPEHKNPYDNDLPV